MIYTLKHPSFPREVYVWHKPQRWGVPQILVFMVGIKKYIAPILDGTQGELLLVDFIGNTLTCEAILISFNISLEIDQRKVKTTGEAVFHLLEPLKYYPVQIPRCKDVHENKSP